MIGLGTCSGVAQQAREAQRKEVIAKIDLALLTVVALCQGEMRWTMSVPAQPDRDPDLVIGAALQAAKDVLTAYHEAVIPGVAEGWQMVPTDPSEKMVIAGFESVSEFRDTDEYAEMSGCKGAAESAKVCYAAMLAASINEAQAETDHLLSSPANAAHLARSIEQARNGQEQARELIDPDASQGSAQ